jgi:diguanylate cyclase (GGDEF)-like protein
MLGTVYSTSTIKQSFKSVLIANDGQDIWTYVKSLLEDSSYAVSTITDGHCGLHSIAADSPDLVIVGEDLGDISGLDWIVKLRHQSPLQKLVFVADKWRKAEFYQHMKTDLAVSLVVHRPFKPSWFVLQIDSMLGLAEPESAQDLTVIELHDFHRLTAMKARYAHVLPDRIERLAEALKQKKHQLDEAMRLAHNMKSCARSCGFRVIGESAEQLERDIQHFMNGTELHASLKNAEHHMRLIAEQTAAIRSKYCLHGVDQSDFWLDDASKAMVFCLSKQAEIDLETPEANGKNNWLKLIREPSFESALSAAKHQPIDGAVIDMALGTRQDALDFAAALRSIPTNENLPLAFISSGHAQEDQIEATRAGGSAFLEKAAGPNEIRSTASYLASLRQGGRPRVLLIDDDPDFCRIVASTLGGNGMLVSVLNDPRKMIEALDDFAPELIILDVMMPFLNGFEVCRKVRLLPRWQDTPIIFLTANADADSRINAFEAGADDYLPKPIIESELLARAKIRLERAKLLRERSDKDVLTGLLLRRAFNDQLNSLLSESTRHHFDLCVSLIDVDHFKQVNDVHGHYAGDLVLSYLGHSFQRCFRSEDLRGRWGGEEFALAFPHTTSSVMRVALNRVLEEFRQKVFEDDQSQAFQVTFSAGMATFPEDGDSAKELLSKADHRLYLAKSTGRNRIVLSD